MKRVENSLDTKQVLTVVERYSQALELLDAYVFCHRDGIQDLGETSIWDALQDIVKIEL